MGVFSYCRGRGFDASGRKNGHFGERSEPFNNTIKGVTGETPLVGYSL